ncbi:unnamed protein product [Lampetra planeri]
MGHRLNARGSLREFRHRRRSIEGGGGCELRLRGLGAPLRGFASRVQGGSVLIAELDSRRAPSHRDRRLGCGCSRVAHPAAAVTTTRFLLPPDSASDSKPKSPHAAAAVSRGDDDGGHDESKHVQGEVQEVRITKCERGLTSGGRLLPGEVATWTDPTRRLRI